jgi:hypothetical protein
VLLRFDQIGKVVKPAASFGNNKQEHRRISWKRSISNSRAGKPENIEGNGVHWDTALEFAVSTMMLGLSSFVIFDREDFDNKIMGMQRFKKEDGMRKKDASRF